MGELLSQCPLFTVVLVISTYLGQKAEGDRVAEILASRCCCACTDDAYKCNDPKHWQQNKPDDADCKHYVQNHQAQAEIDQLPAVIIVERRCFFAHKPENHRKNHCQRPHNQDK